MTEQIIVVVFASRIVEFYSWKVFMIHFSMKVEYKYIYKILIRAQNSTDSLDLSLDDCFPEASRSNLTFIAWSI